MDLDKNGPITLCMIQVLMWHSDKDKDKGLLQHPSTLEQSLFTHDEDFNIVNKYLVTPVFLKKLQIHTM